MPSRLTTIAVATRAFFLQRGALGDLPGGPSQRILSLSPPFYGQHSPSTIIEAEDDQNPEKMVVSPTANLSLVVQSRWLQTGSTEVDGYCTEIVQPHPFTIWVIRMQACYMV